GDYRLGAVYRQQWRSVTLPYRTFGLGGDAAHVGNVEGLGAGAWFYSDKTGDSRLSTFQFTLGASWTQRFGARKEQSLTFGLQGGITSLTIDYSALRFDAQYNGFYYDPSLGTNEQFTRDARTHPDLHAGVIYRYAPAHRQRIEAGFALFNLTTPDIAFFDAAPSPLDRRSMFHVMTQFPVSAKVDVLPMARYMAQGPFSELDLGGMARYILLDRYGIVHAVQGGLFWRAADAGYIHAGLEYEDWTVGVSYDINLSDLEPASRNRGGIEITAVRVFRKRPVVPVRFKSCPDQI
ncbi:MAG TPA: PorP/SprF family type IX secretion system membrane protein, partial [Flavobacteriales bacterium]|nr:PorP/SprF family type IX secretion system membrane protein [Flavobacteriales bacterium]